MAREAYTEYMMTIAPPAPIYCPLDLNLLSLPKRFVNHRNSYESVALASAGSRCKALVFVYSTVLRLRQLLSASHSPNSELAELWILHMYTYCFR